jgi:hypothetical protein
LKRFVSSIDDEHLLSNHKHCQIKRTHPNEKTINNIKFDAMIVEYPQLVYKFDSFEIIAEITIREKQRAVGTQPMLYFCFPVKQLLTNDLIGRCADKNEFSVFEFNPDNYFVILQMMKIFGMLSSSHQADTIAIINTIQSQT